MSEPQPGLLTKIFATVLLLCGSILAYIFVVKIFVSIWNRHTYLLPGFVAVLAGFLIYGGSRLWERWRVALGRVWLGLCTLAFFNAFYDMKMASLPGLSPVVFMGFSRGSLVMGGVALAVGVGLIVWQRILDREYLADLT